MDSEHIRNLRHTRWLAVSGLIAILLASLFGFRQTQVSHNESQQNLAASLAANSAKLLTDSHDRASEPGSSAIESVRINPTLKETGPLRAAVFILPADEKSDLQKARTGETCSRMASPRDGATLAIGRDNGSAQLIDVVNKKPIGYLTPDEEPAANIEVQGAPTARHRTTMRPFPWPSIPLARRCGWRPRWRRACLGLARWTRVAADFPRRTTFASIVLPQGEPACDGWR